MGFSTSGATVILFLGVLASVGVLAPAVEHAAEDVGDAYDGRSDRVLERRNTVVAVANATYNSTAGRLTVAVDNAGSVTLSVAETDLLVDGELAGYDAAVSGVENRTLWAPGETLTVRTNTSSPPARVTLVTGQGVTAVATNVTVV